MMKSFVCARLPLRASALALAACAACAAQAQPSAAALPATVVTATRTAQALSEVLADMSIIDRDTIERSGAAGLGDLLARQPGLELSRSGGAFGATSLFVRGAPSNYTAVYIDGVRVDSQAGSGGVTWETIPLALIERIEVLRGPAAAIYGSDSMAGVVQIFTKKGEQGVSPYVGLGVGSYQTWRGEAGVSGASGALDYALGLVRETSKGFDATTSANKSHNPDRDGYASTAANARLGLQMNAGHRLEGTLLYSDSNSGYDTSAADDRSLHRLQALGLTWAAQWSRHYSTRVAVTDSRDRYETTPSVYLTDTRLRGYLWHNEWRYGGHQFSAALERREDSLINAPIDKSRAQNALALGYGLRSGAHTLQLNARRDDDSEFGAKSSGSAAYGYEFIKNWRATASVGSAFRVPTLYQRFSLYGDASLQPETSRNAELGLKWQDGASHFSVTAYRNRISNLINWVSSVGSCAGNSGPWGGCYANVGQARYEGVTFAAAHRLGGVQLYGSLDVQNPKNLDTGKLLARRARQHATLGADTQLSGWTVGGELQMSGKRYDDAANKVELGGYTLLGLHASTRLARDYQLLARVDNLSDKNYTLANGYATAGRSFYLGVKWAPKN